MRFTGPAEKRPSLNRAKTRRPDTNSVAKVYFFLGRHDKVVSAEVAQQYFDVLDAPHGKQIVWFEESGHWPHFEESEKYRESLIRVLNETKPR